MLKLIKKSDLQIMPWKNGRGMSAQIAIHPKNAIFPADDFLWRLSSASVNSRDSFSIFPNYNRILVVWQGKGLRLNGQDILPDQPHFFPGDQTIDCELIDGIVVDLGLIYRRDQVTADMQVLEFDKTHNKLSLQGSETVHFLVCASGSFETQGYLVETGDTLRISHPMEMNLTSKPGPQFKLYHVSLSINGLVDG